MRTFTVAVLFVTLAVLVVGQPRDAQANQPVPCTAGISSVVMGGQPVTEWLPRGCVHP